MAAKPVEQLLLVWNPLYEPRTIKVHVDTLRRATSDRYVWWGRIYAGSRKMDKAMLREKWGYVRELYKSAQKARRDLVVFVTDYNSLHALRVDYVKYGPALPDDDLSRIPDYYLEEDRNVGLWFRVRDIRALTHYQLRTLEYYREMLGTVKDSVIRGEKMPYDPYAAFKYEYPVVISGQRAEEVFDEDELAQRDPKAKGFADARETVFPPDMRTILAELGEELQFLWEDLRDNSKIFLGSARLLEKRYGDLTTFDFSTAMCELAKAVEVELIDGLIHRLAVLDAERWDSEELDDYRRIPSWKRPRSLGTAGALIESLNLEDAPPELVALRRLAAPGSPWLSWFDEFRGLRNRALHSKLVPYEKYQEAWAGALSRTGDTGLGPVIEAQKEARSASCA